MLKALFGTRALILSRIAGGQHMNHQYIPYYVHTQRGVVNIANVIPTDFVYEYKTNKMFEVRGIKKSNICKLYKVKYSDGRTSIHPAHEPIYTGRILAPIGKVHSCNNNVLDNILDEFETYAVEFNMYHEMKPLMPDPYIAGALLMYGDFTIDEVNLPLHNYTTFQEIMYKYQLESYGIPKGSTVTFKRVGTDEDSSPLTWKEFFCNTYAFPCNKNHNSPIIPSEYKYASLNDRMQFIRGAFDAGYREKHFPDSVGLVNDSRQRLYELQKMLWSVGVNSRLDQYKHIEGNNDKSHRLELVGVHEGYPGVFYELDSILTCFKNDYTLIKHHPVCRLYIRSITECGTGYVYNLELEDKNIVYITGDFLPRVSL